MVVGMLPLLLTAALIPLSPRPTAGGLLAFPAPALVVFVVASAAMAIAVGTWVTPLQARDLRTLLGLLLLPLVFYGIGVFQQSGNDELVYLASRMAMAATIVAIYVLCVAARVAPRRVGGALLVGYLLLSLLIAFSSLTGLALFEPVGPARDYGVALPFGKTSGLPRSYGELSILSSTALAYLLVHRGGMQRSLWVPAMVLVLMSIVMAQSRTGFVAALFVLVTFATQVWFRARVTRAVLTVLAVAPFLILLLYPLLRDGRLVVSFVGENTISRNVDYRIGIYEIALEQLRAADLSRVAFGLDRAEWLALMTRTFGTPFELHNNWLSNVLFLGWIGGVMAILVILLPLFRLASSVDPDARFLVLAGIGAVVSLQFYEGFFSLVLALQVGVSWYWRAVLRDRSSRSAREDEQVLTESPQRGQPVG